MLQAAGHRAVAPDLPGLGADTTPVAAVTLDLWADHVADIARRQTEPVILVGHSRGGIVISCAAERAAENIRELVYLSAFLLPDGWTMTQASSGILRELAPNFFRETDAGLGLAVNPDFIPATLYNTTASEWVQRATLMMQREPVMSWSSPVHVTSERFGGIPRTYIECLRDCAIPLELQRLMQRELPCQRSFALDTDHSPFYSSPQLLVEMLCRIAEAA
jgi:pimeloyl-ACP methyl ester carboxylesterase